MPAPSNVWQEMTQHVCQIHIFRWSRHPNCWLENRPTDLDDLITFAHAFSLSRAAFLYSGDKDTGMIATSDSQSGATTGLNVRDITSITVI